MAKDFDFSGIWHFCHWYPSSDDKSEEKGDYEMAAHQKGDDIVFESKDEDGREAYMFVRLKIDGTVATGTWHENAEMHGPFKGVSYSGAGQLVVSEDGKYMDGMWAGAGFDHTAGKPRIYTGRWELRKVK